MTEPIVLDLIEGTGDVYLDLTTEDVTLDVATEEPVALDLGGGEQVALDYSIETEEITLVATTETVVISFTDATVSLDLGEPEQITLDAGPVQGPMGPQGPPGTSATLFRYTYSSNGSPPPNAGQVRSDGTTAATATLLWVHRLDDDKHDERIQLLLAKAGDRLFVQDAQDSTSYALYTLTADPVDNTDYVTFAVALDDAGPAPLVGSGVLLGVVREGPPGPPGPPGQGASFVWNQGTADVLWSIVHDVPYRPNVTIVDSAGTVLIADVSYPDDTTVLVSHDYPTAGYAYLS